MKVYDAVANAFVKEGMTTLFGLLGDGQMTWWAALAKHPGVKIIDVREEGAAVAMAEGWAMASGKVGVASSTQGPGLARMTTSLIVASRSRTPIVVFTSRTPFNDENIVQHLNQEPLVHATGAGYIEVLTPSFAEQAVRQAFYRAKLESRPIVLCLPIQIQNMECDSDGDDYVPSAAMFAGQQRIRPDLERLDQAVGIIAAAKKPVIVVGRGARTAQALEAAERLAKRIGALTATTLFAKGALAESEYHAGISGQFSTREVMQLFAEADCVIALGASLRPHTLSGGYLYPKARVVHIDVQPHVLMGNEQSADCYVQGDATVTTQAINEMLEKQSISNEGYRTAAVRKILRDSGRDPAEFEIEPGTVDPREVARVLDERLPANVGFVTGNAHNFTFPAMAMKKPRSLQIFGTSFGCIGQALPNAIGIAVAAGEPIVCVEGDGGAMQNIQELDTAARLGVKLLYLVMNDEAYGAEYHKLRASGRDGNLSVVRTPDFGVLGRDFGCRGRTARTVAEFEAGVDEFLAGDGPMVIDLRISRNVLSIPYRRLHHGQDV